MPFCPECGGEMTYDSRIRKYACKSCGLSLTYQELIEIRDRSRPDSESPEEKRRRVHKEYLKWWLSKKD
ncbi:zinc ribbon domain-containing protein [Candidatus Bathyarchaeota archaeon]|nr:zinc ribbon domain-containing protein [Candidatus Bathyarchaeota archaeon]